MFGEKFGQGAPGELGTVVLVVGAGVAVAVDGDNPDLGGQRWLFVFDQAGYRAQLCQVLRGFQCRAPFRLVEQT